MNFRSRAFVLYPCIAVLVLVLSGGVIPSTLHKQNLNTFFRDSANQLKHVDFALSNLIDEVRYDVFELSLNKEVSTLMMAGLRIF
jgi:hypothetical protein